MSERDHTPNHGPDPELLLRHGASVRALAGAILGDAHAADDVAQEAYLAALRGGTVPVRDTGKWLRGVTRNLARKWIRTESRRRRREDARPAAVAAASPEETAERLETESSLTDAVRALAEPYRTVVVLRYFDGLSTAETAARTKAPEATVKTRLRRALSMLRDRLDDRYGVRSAWIPLLIRVARPRDPATAAAATTAAVGSATLLAGGVLMAKKLLIVVVLAAVVAAVYISVSALDLAGPGSGPAGNSEAPPVVAEGVVPDSGSPSPDSAEPDPGSSAIPIEEAFRVTVRHFDGTPAAGATVRLVDLGGRDRGNATTDDDGNAVLRATGAAGVVHVAATGALPETREVTAIGGGSVVVDLAEGAVVSGTLLFGEKPARNVELRMHSYDPAVKNLSVVTDARGAFRFSGLPAGARVTLFAGWDVYFVDPPGKRNVGVNAPATDLALRAARHPAIVGLVVDSEGKPIEGAAVDCHYGVDGESRGSHEVKTGADGRFRASASVGAAAIDHVRIEVVTPDRGGREVVEVRPAAPRPGDVDAGRIVIRAPRTFRFEVTGPDGKAVAGARVLSPDDRKNLSAPTNAEGVTELSVGGGTGTVRVGAAGAGNVEVRLPEEVAGPIPVRLPGGTLLTLRLRKADGSAPRFLDLELRADTRLLDGPEDLVWDLYPESGAAEPKETHQTDAVTRLRYRVSGFGIVRVGGIRPGVRFRVVVLDRLASAEVETRKLTLNPGERREVDVVLNLNERTLVVGVKDGEGRPVADARVVARGRRLGIHARTTSEGLATLPDLRGDEIRLEVEKHGFVPVVETYPLASLPDEVPVVLRAGRKVRLTVVNPAGEPVVAEWVAARADDLDYEFQPVEMAEGIYEFRDLPAKAVHLAVTYAGKVHEVISSAADGAARVSLPAVGSLVARFEGKLEHPVMHRLRLVPTGGGTEVCGDVDYHPERVHHENRVPAVMPGTYRVLVEHWVDTTEDDEDVFELTRDLGTVQVAAGREARVGRSR